MPFYDFACANCGEKYEKSYTYAKVPPAIECPCGNKADRILFYKSVTTYGTDRFSESAFQDASEASGEVITNTKQVDRLEREGKMYAITNPSRARKFKEKK